MKKFAVALILVSLLFAAGPVLAQAPEGEAYTVQANDWLSKLAEKYYGDVLAYPSIVEATNAKAAEDDTFAVITNPDVIEVGQKLWIPTTAEASTPAETMTESEAASAGGVVTELAIRRLNEGQDVAEFATARDTFVAALTSQPGVGTDREFAAFLDFSTFAPPEPPVFIGMTEYESLAAFAAASEALGQSPEAGALFATFTPVVFTALTPLNPADRYDLAALANQPGQVLEIAARDLSTYENFDQADYEAKRDTFLAELAQQDGFVAEYQWVSVLDPNIVVGMTVYASGEAFQAIATSAFAQSAANTQFLGTYPPLAGYITADARATAE